MQNNNLNHIQSNRDMEDYLWFLSKLRTCKLPLKQNSTSSFVNKYYKVTHPDYKNRGLHRRT